MVSEENTRLIRARQRIENLVVEFIRCGFTYDEVPTTRNRHRSAASAPNSPPPGPSKPSLSTKILDRIVNATEKVGRKAGEIATGQEISRRFEPGCIFQPGDKVRIQNYVSSLDLPCQLRFVDCTFEHRGSSFWERIWKFILNCCGGPSFDEFTNGLVTIQDETFQLDELPNIIDKLILRIQQRASEPSITV